MDLEMFDSELIDIFWSVAYQSYENDEETDDPGMNKPPNMRVLERDYEKLVLINRTRPTPCDREMYLYQLTDYSNLDAKLNVPVDDKCHRPFYAQHVNYTNMLMIVVDANCPKLEVAAMSVDATEVNYNESLPCLKHMHPLYRKQPTSCIRNHTEVCYCSNIRSHLVRYAINAKVGLYLHILNSSLSW